jgi:hypothetical protein
MLVQDDSMPSLFVSRAATQEHKSSAHGNQPKCGINLFAHDVLQ